MRSSRRISPRISRRSQSGRVSIAANEGLFSKQLTWLFIGRGGGGYDAHPSDNQFRWRGHLTIAARVAVAFLLATWIAEPVKRHAPETISRPADVPRNKVVADPATMADCRATSTGARDHFRASGITLIEDAACSLAARYQSRTRPGTIAILRLFFRRHEDSSSSGAVVDDLYLGTRRNWRSARCS